MPMAGARLRGLEMTRLALQEFPAAMLADKFSIAHGDLPAHGDDAGAAFNSPALKRAVVHIHVLGLDGDFELMARGLQIIYA